jgi:hypothetical protein
MGRGVYRFSDESQAVLRRMSLRAVSHFGTGGQILDLWLACGLQEEIAQRVGWAVGKVSEFFTKRTSSFSEKTDSQEYARAHHAEESFDRPLYNVWKQQEKSAGAYWRRFHGSISKMTVMTTTRPAMITTTTNVGGISSEYTLSAHSALPVESIGHPTTHRPPGAANVLEGRKRVQTRTLVNVPGVEWTR